MRQDPAGFAILERPYRGGSTSGLTFSTLLFAKLLREALGDRRDSAFRTRPRLLEISVAHAASGATAWCVAGGADAAELEGAVRELLLSVFR